MDTPLFFALLFVHVVSFAVGFGSVVVIDTFGLCFLLKLFGVDLRQVTSVANITQKLIWLGFAGLVASGIPMLVLKGSVDGLTQLKLFLVLVLAVNGIFLHYIKKSMERLGNPETFTPKIAFQVGLASAISQIGWWGALTIGFAHRHIAHTIHFPISTVWIMAALLLCIAAATLIAKLRFKSL